jgi:hypothetical protein
VALEVIRWRARTLESKDKEIIPDDMGFVTTAEVDKNNARTSK